MRKLVVVRKDSHSDPHLVEVRRAVGERERPCVGEKMLARVLAQVLWHAERHGATRTERGREPHRNVDTGACGNRVGHAPWVDNAEVVRVDLELDRKALFFHQNGVEIIVRVSQCRRHGDANESTHSE
eukprot:Amastigsp_a678432_24.p2 type:complete len:128 gc:universal Amastigsp_a678432_24:211-594(+)